MTTPTQPTREFIPVSELVDLRDRILDLVVDDAKTFAFLVIIADEIAEIAGIPTAEFARDAPTRPTQRVKETRG